MEYTEELREAAWQKAKVVEGVDPDSYRKDEHGAWIRKCRYNQCNIPLSFGWVIIEVNTEKTPGNPLPELKAMQWQNAQAKLQGNDNVMITADGFYNYLKKIRESDPENDNHINSK